jgi:cytochrome P450
LGSHSLYDPTRPDFQDRSYEIYRALRDEHPCYRDEAAGFWALSRFDDVRAAANDPGTFSSENTEFSRGLKDTLQSLDPPRHDALRDLVSVAFTPRRVAGMEPRIRAIARDLVDDFAADGRADLLGQFARHLPSRVIGELIGIPPERIGDFLEWTEAFVVTSSDSSDLRRVAQLAGRIYGEFATLLEERRREPRDDLMSALLAAELDGRRLSQDELLGFCFVLVVAGNDTTTNLIANGAVLLARHPEQRRLLVGDAALIPGAVEEMLRFESPAQALPRRTTRDVALHGRTVPAGSSVKLLWGAANRDEREFEQPERFEVRRPTKRHLAFGQGVHFCLGSHLARLEGRVAFEELLARIPDYALEAEPGWLPSLWARAHDRVPVCFDGS